MPVKKRIPYDHGFFFITFTCFSWISLIDITNSYDLIYAWFDYLKKKSHYINGYVIMPNHVHALIGFRNTGKSINKIVGDGKRFIGYEIVNRLQSQNNSGMLNKLAKAVNRSDKMRDKQHEIWANSFDWKACDTWEIIVQKLDYMHKNPCAGKWKLVENPVDYIHSSAKYYITGEQGVYAVTNFMELEDVDLSKRIIS